jgi:protoporphyrinogen oxidase
MDQRVVGLKPPTDDEEPWQVTAENSSGEEVTYAADHVISSMPMRGLVFATGTAPDDVQDAARSLKYRDFLIVALMTRGPDRFTDNWIYIHDPAVSVGRVQNFKSWSPEMVPDPETNCYGMEYFCSEGDEIWENSDEDLIASASRELVALGLASDSEIEDGYVIRQRKAYPVYDSDYASHVDTIRKWTASTLPGLHLIGRNGMHKYNNQDHAIMTAMLTVENILAGEELFDPWEVNEDAEYHESGEAGASGMRSVPMPATVNRTS